MTYSDPASVDKVLASGTHELDGKKVRTLALLCVFGVFVVMPLYGDGDVCACWMRMVKACVKMIQIQCTH